MATENIAISKQYLLKAYREAEPSQKEFMKQLFGADTFVSSVMERIKTFQDALNELGYDNDLVKAYKESMPTFIYTDAKDILAYLKLRIIVAALNEGWQPKFTKNECRYYPYFYVPIKEEYEHLKDDAKGRCVGRSSSSAGAYGGLVFSDAFYASSGSCSSVGVRLAFRTKELAQYAGKQFLNIWADFIFKIGDTDKIEAE